MPDVLQRAGGGDEVRRWALELGPVAALRRVRAAFPGPEAERLLGLSPALQLAAETVLREQADSARGLDSIPFYSLGRGLLLPLMNMPGERVSRLFGLTGAAPLEAEHKRQLVADFLARDLGLSLREKVGLVLGDPFLGRAPAVREDTLTALLASLVFWPLAGVRESIPRAGDLAGLFAMSCSHARSDPPLSTRQVLAALRGLRDLRPRQRREVLRELYLACGRLERYLLTGLILNKLHLALSARQDYLFGILARQYHVQAEQLEAVATLTDPFEMARILEEKGPEGLAQVTLKPLSPLRPALAGASLGSELRFPTWFECKYDGVRLMLHKDTDGRGRPLVGAFTRRRSDWVELIPGVTQLVACLPCRSLILDGELHGTVLADNGLPRPCTVYEVHQYLRGERMTPVSLRYVAFDVLYLNGQDVTRRPFRERRLLLEQLVGPLSSWPMPLPIAISQGSRVENREQLNRLYEQYRRQGHEGGMVKLEESVYPIAERTTSWIKRKPEESLDLVMTGAFWSDPAHAGQRMFDSYVISCRGPEGLQEVGTVGGLDGQTTLQIGQAIMRHNLLTGQTLTHRGNLRTATGIALAPYLIVGVRFEALVRDEEGRVALRSPRIVSVRPGEMPLSEIASVADLERLHMRQGLA